MIKLTPSRVIVFALILTAFLVYNHSFAQPSPAQLPTTAQAQPSSVADGDIVHILKARGQFNQLVQALEDTGLAATLANQGPFTIFAPTDEAFSNIPEGTLAAMSREELANILRYHVLEGRHAAADLEGREMLSTVLGTSLAISGASVGGAEISEADIQADNGIIHVINAVLLPPGQE